MASPVQIYLNSADATDTFNGSKNTDMLFLFSSPVIPPRNYNMTLKVINLYIPVSFYIIDDDNNTFSLNGTDYTIPEGNYTATELATAIMGLINGTFTIVFSSITNKFTFTDTNNFTIGGSCLYVLGFTGFNTAFSTDLELVSIYPVDLTGQNILYVDVRNLTTFNLSSSSGTRTSIISSILVNVPYGSILYHEDTSGTAFTIQEDNISFVHLRLLGEDQTTPIDLNGFHWSITLEIGFVEKTLQPAIQNSYKDIYKDYLLGMINKA